MAPKGAGRAGKAPGGGGGGGGNGGGSGGLCGQRISVVIVTTIALLTLAAAMAMFVIATRTSAELDTGMERPPGMGRPSRADAPAVLHLGSGTAAKATRLAAAAAAAEGAPAAPAPRKKRRRSGSPRKLYRIRPTLPDAGDDEAAGSGAGAADALLRDMEPDTLHSLDDIVALIAATEEFEVTPAPATAAATVPPVVNSSRPPLPTVVIKDESALLPPPAPPRAFHNYSTLWADGLSAAYLAEDDVKRGICTAHNLCIKNRVVFVPIESEAQRDLMNRQLSLCNSTAKAARPALCACFMPTTRVNFVSAWELGGWTYYPQGHTWLFDHYVTKHQLGHWSQTSGMFFSSQRHRRHYGLPPVDQVLVPKLVPPLEPLEQFYFQVALASVQPPPLPPLWKHDTEDVALCFHRLTLSTVTGAVAPSHDDAEALRTAALQQSGLTLPQCPPARTVILLRSDKEPRRRRVLNYPEVEALLHRLGVKYVDVVTASADNSTMEQLALFNSAGLVLSSHSSQLVNMIVMRHGSQLIEMAPAFHNFDFANTAYVFGLGYHMVIGGHAEGIQSVPPLVQQCHQDFASCDGKDWTDCLRGKVYGMNQLCSKSDTYKSFSTAVKVLDFTVDLDQVEKAVLLALKHLNKACGGTWPGVL